jgi:hypothetical protein
MILRRVTGLYIVKDEKGDVVTDCNSILIRWRTHFSQSLNIRDVRHTEIHTAGPLVPEHRNFGVEMATEKLKGHKSPGTNQIPAELIKAGSKIISSEIYKHINTIRSKDELLEE